MDRTQDELTAHQFGAQAEAYLASAVHAAGADLAQLAALVRPGARVLDLGCGGGHVAYAAAAAGGVVTAVDLSPEMLGVVAAEATRRGLAITTERAAAEALPFAAGGFDVVLSRFSAHHWRDLEAGLREAARVSRPEGVLGFADAVSPGVAALDTHLQAVEALRDVSHVRDRNLAEWCAASGAAGLLTQAVTTARLRMDFAEWTRRMATPVPLVQAIRALQAAAAESVRRHYVIEPDGSFTIDTAVLILRKAPL